MMGPSPPDDVVTSERGYSIFEGVTEFMKTFADGKR